MNPLGVTFAALTVLQLGLALNSWRRGSTWTLIVLQLVGAGCWAVNAVAWS